MYQQLTPIESLPWTSLVRTTSATADAGQVRLASHVYPAATLVAMHPELKALDGLDELDRVLAASNDRLLLLFKYSATCGTSAEALDELVAHLNESKADATYAMVTVQTHRDVSNAVARKLGVRHETPQALLIRDGRVIWSASHFRVTAAALEEALREAINCSQPTVQ